MRGVACMLLTLAAGAAAADNLSFQSHRGGMNEVPENTLAALRHSWAIAGAVPEIDLRTTRDGVIVCIHDRTPERTTDAAEPWTETPIDKTPLEEVRKWDAGAWFDGRYAGERVPTLEEVFALMTDHPEREIYLDLKAVDLDDVVATIDAHDLRAQVLWVHGSPVMCKRLSETWDGARVMTWLSGESNLIMRRFEKMAEKDFYGVKQLQFHLHATRVEPEIDYDLDWVYLERAAERLADAGVALQVRPFEFDARSLHRLIALGATWFVADDPEAFRAALDEAMAYAPAE